MGDESVGTKSPDPYCVVLDLGRAYCRTCFSDRACDLRPLLRRRNGLRFRYLNFRNARVAPADSAALPGRQIVSLDHGSADVCVMVPHSFPMLVLSAIG